MRLRTGTVEQILLPDPAPRPPLVSLAST